MHEDRRRVANAALAPAPEEVADAALDGGLLAAVDGALHDSRCEIVREQAAREVRRVARSLLGSQRVLGIERVRISDW